ncbi:hypothetical protein LSAT2_019998 [Lamellibrachia satsuma]|nr:hypothetical protein LSAT2_019998 [Lamellibrachia satsuma]
MLTRVTLRPVAGDVAAPPSGPHLAADLFLRASAHFGVLQEFFISRIHLGHKGDSHGRVMAEWYKTVYHFLAPADHPNDRHQDMNAALIWRGFKETTSVHGISQIDRAAGVVKKIFWCLLPMMTFGALLFNITNITRSFFRFNVNVHVELLHVNEMTFPAVTVCNMSPVRKSALDLFLLHNKSVAELAKTGQKKRNKRATFETSVTCNDTTWSPYLTDCYTGLSPSVVNTYNETVSKARVLDKGKLVVITTAEQQAFIATVTA